MLIPLLILHSSLAASAGDWTGTQAPDRPELAAERAALIAAGGSIAPSTTFATAALTPAAPMGPAAPVPAALPASGAAALAAAAPAIAGSALNAAAALTPDLPTAADSAPPEDAPEDAPEDEPATVVAAAEPPDEPLADPAAEARRRPRPPRDPGYPFDIRTAEEMELVSPSRMRWLKPKRARLPQDPYSHTDFTAYTLQWGEVKMGPTELSVGVLPRTQIGTSLILDTLGIYNAQAKVNAVRWRTLDLSVDGEFLRIPVAGFVGTRWSGGSTLSWQLLDPWSMHLGADYQKLEAHGMPDITQLPPFLITAAAGDSVDIAAAQAEIDAAGVDLSATARAWTVRTATDIRLNRRDSIILQGQAMVWAEVITNSDQHPIPPILGLDEVFKSRENALPIADTYAASIAWQLAMKRAELRIGVGTSAVPGAWLLQTTRLSWRLGGETRREERAMLQGWVENRRDLKAARREQRRR